MTLPTPRRRKRLALLLVLLAAALSGGLVLNRFQSGATESEALTTKVVLADIEQAILASGVLEPIQMVNVGAQASGQVTRLFVQLGQRVKAGDPIAEIDAVQQQSALRMAEATLAATSAQKAARVAALKQARVSFERQKNLLSKDATSRTDFETAENLYQAAQSEIDALAAQIKRAELEVEAARLNLAYTHVVSPIDGVVISVVTKQGQVLNAAQSVPTVVVVAQMDRMSIKVQISEADVAKVSQGQEVWFTLLGRDSIKYTSKLELIEPAPNNLLSQSAADAGQGSAGVYYNGLFTIENADGQLRPLMTAQVHIVTGRAKQVPAILVSALAAPTGEEAQDVTVVGTDRQTETRSIRTGVTDNVYVEVTHGLAEGEVVMLKAGEAGVPFDMFAGGL